MRISDWSSDVCSSDLGGLAGARLTDHAEHLATVQLEGDVVAGQQVAEGVGQVAHPQQGRLRFHGSGLLVRVGAARIGAPGRGIGLGGTFVDVPAVARSDQRRVGKDCGRPCGYRWSPSNYKTKKEPFWF